VKFARRGGHVTLDAAAEGSLVRIAVRDDGIGIDPAFLPHVFAPFRQADAAASRRHQGLGLGLSIVSQLVERHGGTVAAESEGAGRGACFTVRLPVSPLDGPPAPPPPAGSTRIDRLRVLIVEDDRIAREMLATLLRRAGAEPVEAASAAEGFAALATALPDLIISDLEMPGEDGFGLLRRVRALAADAGGATPALALTAHARPEDRQAALAAGFQEHLAKPVDAAALLAALGRLAAR
jgi:CheY-like chemotaxis protein